MVNSQRPVTVRVRMYQVGFGDCFLVSFEYAKKLPADDRDVRHLLIDAGSTYNAKGGLTSATQPSAIAQLIADHTAGKLDVLAVTHRHRDHLSMFDDDSDEKKKARQILKDLKPDRVLRSWTEDPKRRTGSRDTSRLREFLSTVDAAQETATQVDVPGTDRSFAGSVRNAVEEQRPNADAVALLHALSCGDRGRYLFEGVDPGTKELLPGVTITVLGPPTLDQSPDIKRQASKSAEYWFAGAQRSLAESVEGLHAMLPGLQLRRQQVDAVAAPDDEGSSDDPSDAGSDQAAGSRPAGAPTVEPGPRRWLVNQLTQHALHSVNRLVHTLDEVLNNTSLILMIEVGDDLRMLFPGDAQIENWDWILSKAESQKSGSLRRKLANLDLYKVGHHGSRNANPRTRLVGLWETDRETSRPRMTSLMSTRSDVHGKSPQTAVPSANLIQGLERISDLYSTEDLKLGKPYIEVEAPVSGGPFTLVTDRDWFRNEE